MAWFLKVLLVAFLVLPLKMALLPTDVTAEVATITGRVTSDLNGSPVPYTEVHLIDAATPANEIVAAVTDENGLYTVTQSISNTWKIKFVPTQPNPFFSQPHIPEYYNDVYTLEEATPITAEVGAAVANINASLSTSGQISGHITDEANGQPIADVFVEAYMPGSDSPADSTSSDSSGSYTLTTYSNGSRYLKFVPPANTEYAIEFYNNKTRLPAGDVVTVQADRDVRDIDISLTKGGQIKGIVTSSRNGQFTEYPEVRAFNEQGELVQVGSRNLGEGVELEPPGHYTLANLPAGNYRLLFLAHQHRPVTTTEVLHVDAGEVIPDIDAQLTMSTYVDSIATSPAIPGTIVITKLDDPVPLITTDEGRSWQLLPSTPWLTATDYFRYPDMYYSYSMSAAVAPRGQPGEGTRIVVASSTSSALDQIGSIYRSGDIGQSWSIADVDPPIPTDTCHGIGQSSIIVSPVKATDLYLAFNCPFGSTIRLLTSDNAGVTWHDVSTVEGRTLLLGGVNRVVASPLVEERLYAYNQSGKWSLSNDAGIHWEEKTFPVESLALDSKNENYFYGWTLPQGGPTTRFGKRSRDGGNQWEDWPQQPCPYSYRAEPPQLLASPTQTQVLFLRCDNDLTDGLYRSDNGGDGWAKLEDEKGQLLAIDYSTPGRILWAKDDGLWASTDNGETWQVLLSEYKVFARSLHLPGIANNH